MTGRGDDRAKRDDDHSATPFDALCRRMIALTRGLAAALCVSLLASPPDLGAAEPLAVEATERRLDPERPSLDRVGSLRSLGVLQLRSDDPRFGGLSGLLVSPDGARLEAVTDEGNWIALELTYGPAGRLSGVRNGRIAALTDREGRPLGRKSRQDAEALAIDGDGLLVAFEHRHRIWRYARANGALAARPEQLPDPPGLQAQPDNEGIEAMARLADGRLLAIGSKTVKPDHYPAFLRAPAASTDQGAWHSLWYYRAAPYEPTGATVLPDGDLAVLERRFSLLGGLAVRLVQVSGASIAPGATLTGRELAVLKPPLTLDNYEGIAARRGPDGETLVYLLSDDNFNLLQRTLLALFVLDD